MICSRERQENEESNNSELFLQGINVEEGDEEEEDEEEDERLGSGALHHLAMLHLNSAAKRRPTPEKCTACGGAMKRPSPSSSSLLQEPSPKRLTLLPPSPSPLYRSRSEPIDSLSLLNNNIQTTTADQKNSSKISSAPSPPKISDSRPPFPPPLHRSLSDPTVALEFQPPPAKISPTPPRPSPVAPQTVKSPPEESPNTKRLKRMKDRLKQMRQWWGEVLEEEEEEDEEEEDDSNAAAQDNNNSKEKEEEKGEEGKTASSGEESVWVEEKGGEGLVIHFKCPCKKGYEILLSGNNCYYKLM